MDNEDVVNIYNGIFLSHKKSEIVSFVEMWMDLETVIQTEVSQEDKNKTVLQALLALLWRTLRGLPVSFIKEMPAEPGTCLSFQLP